MPELPDITIYIEALSDRILNQPLERVRIASPFFLRSVEPSVASLQGRRVTGLHRLGKRIVFELEGETFLVLHLMISGRLRWSENAGVRLPGKIGLAACDFPSGSLLVTEASTRKRASLYAVSGTSGLVEHDPGGIDVAGIGSAALGRALTGAAHTLKRALTDPRILSGVGNAYSDEILHAARLSPFQRTPSLTPAEIKRLHAAITDSLSHWTRVLREEFAGRFPGPGEITAFRPGFAVHGKFGRPCPDCGTQLDLVHTGLPGDEEREHHTMGWNGSLDKVEALYAS